MGSAAPKEISPVKLSREARYEACCNDKDVDGGDIVSPRHKNAIAEHRACPPVQVEPRPAELRRAFARH
jgi:hypothetical protein